MPARVDLVSYSACDMIFVLQACWAGRGFSVDPRDDTLVSLDDISYTYVKRWPC